MTAAVAVVTDSTADLTTSLTSRYGIRVVPLRIVAGAAAADDGPGAWPDSIEAELRHGARLSTASPAPERFAAAYAAAAQDAAGIVSVHLSGSLSGTVNSALVAAAGTAVPVQVVDSRTLGMGLGFAVLDAAEAAAAGQPLEEVAEAARRRSARLHTFLALDSLDGLRGGGRLEPARPGAAPGLTSRPLLHVADGRIEVLERVRTRSAAQRRLEELAVAAAAGQRVDVAVQHLDRAEDAAALAGRLEQLIPGVRHRSLADAGHVILAHTGPGLLGVVVAPY
ncbi:MAG TPA: DegV family protein [Streptosporangiaceae bacterium]|jgi:DegV family protein with EDD domain